jgi:glycerol-3-phosphate acyltransferase PlsY
VTAVTAVLATFLLGYTLGSIQPGLVVGRVYRGIDIREYGSGKTGFTNTLRTLGLGAALIVVALDIAKGVVPVLLARLLLDDPWAATGAGVGAVLGHTWPIFAGFRGGRGVATSFGAFFAMAPLAALAALAAGGAILAVTRYVSVMSMLGVALGLVAMIVFIQLDWLPAEYLVFGVAVTLSVELNHLGNLRRLIAGTEPKLGQGGAPRAPRGA